MTLDELRAELLRTVRGNNPDDPRRDAIVNTMIEKYSSDELRASIDKYKLFKEQNDAEVSRLDKLRKKLVKGTPEREALWNQREAIAIDWSIGFYMDWYLWHAYDTKWKKENEHKFDPFQAEYLALCRKHGITFTGKGEYSDFHIVVGKYDGESTDKEINSWVI